MCVSESSALCLNVTRCSECCAVFPNVNSLCRAVENDCTGVELRATAFQNRLQNGVSVTRDGSKGRGGGAIGAIDTPPWPIFFRFSLQ